MPISQPSLRMTWSSCKADSQSYCQMSTHTNTTVFDCWLQRPAKKPTCAPTRYTPTRLHAYTPTRVAVQGLCGKKGTSCANAQAHVNVQQGESFDAIFICKIKDSQ
jgi:hypothetical protein